MKTETTAPLRYGEYLRKSTDDKEKQVLSLGSQRDVLDRLHTNHNLTVIETIEEKMSAKRPGRPGFGRLMALIKQRKINAIVTWAPHRLTRNVSDLGEIINLFDIGLLKEIVTESHTFRNNPMDIFMLGFHGLQAKLENDNKAIDVKGGMVKCAKNGIYPACPPLGYLPDKFGIKGARKRLIDPINFPIVRRMWELMLMGTHTPYQIFTVAIEEWGLRTRTGKIPSQSNIYRIFHDPFYYGEFEFPKKSGIFYPGHHKPMITKAEFERVQKMLRKKTNARPIKHYFTFGGRCLHCGECGCTIVGMAKTKRQQNGNVHHYTYYGCTKKRGTCKQKPLTEKEIILNVETILGLITIPRSLHDFLMEWVLKENGKQFEAIDDITDSNKRALELNTKKIDGLIDMRASGLITDDEFQERRTDLDAEKTRLSQLVKDADDNKVTWLDMANKLFTFAELAATRFKDASPEVQRGIMVSLGWNLAITEKELDLSREEWIEPVKQIAKKLNDELPTLEPLSPLENKDKIENLLKSPFMCSLLQDVRNSFIKNPDSAWFPIVATWKREEEKLE